MESKRINWNKILKSAIAGIGFTLVCLLIGIFAIIPLTKVSAIDVIWDYNSMKNSEINFIAAKTKVRNANNYSMDTYSDKNGKNFNAYKYTYSDEEISFYETSNSNNKLDYYSSIHGATTLRYDDNKLVTYDKIEKSSSSNYYIPSNAEYFLNISGNIENVFYDEVDENDFVLLDNYTSHQNITNAGDYYDVENLYLAFGSHVDEDARLITNLSISAYLFTEDAVHELALNPVIPNSFEDPNGNQKYSDYWYQYLDLRNILGKKTAEGETYAINDQQGKYVFTFYFSTYDDNFVAAETANESFTFSFYLLDSANYDTYPEIETNNNSNYINAKDIREYYYNYNTDSPTITYDPTKYNLSYTRENREIKDNVTSEYSLGTYTYNGRNYPRHLITYTKNGNISKNVYILTYYNDDKTQVEHLYLSSKDSYASGLAYSEYKTNIDNNKLDFEYKITKTLTTDGTKYTITSYKSILTSNYAWGLKDAHATPVPSKTYDTASINLNNLNTSEIKYLISPTQIPLDIEYEITFDDLGIYTFNYSYIITAYMTNDNPSNADATYAVTTIVNNLDNSTNILSPEKYHLTYTKDTNTSKTIDTVVNEDLVISSWGYLNANYAIELNGIEYTYNPTDETINYISNIDGSAKSKNLNDIPGDNPQYTKIGDLNNIPTNFKLEPTADGIKLEVSYVVGTINQQQTTRDYVNTENKITQNKTITTNSYWLYDGILDNFSTQVEWSNIKSLLEYLNDKSYSVSNSDYTISSPIMDSDKLHMFGSIAYFNKIDETTDSGYAKLQLVDVNSSTNYVSDVTKYYTGDTSNLNNLKGFSTKITNLDDMIIATDMGSISWKNFSTLLYEGKISKSYIYRYPNYSFAANGTLTLGNADTSLSYLYTKDMRVELDGLYEVIVVYNYDYFKPDNATAVKTQFYQLFTFIIDNKAPSISIKLYNDNNEGYTDDLPSSEQKKYTNKDVEISWPKPTYFQNDIFITIDKNAYHADYASYNYSVKYSKGSFNSSLSSDYLTDATSNSEDVYRIRIDSDNVHVNGDYKVTIHCGASASPATSKEFTIDKENIDGTKILPIVQNNDGSYSVATLSDYYTTNNTNQIINFDFTFRYNKKKSNAEITTYWYKINLTQSKTYDELLNLTTEEQAITTNYEVEGSTLTSIASKNRYLYDYSTGNNVNNNNIFIDTNSAIYLFKLVDAAGNECRYVVFYDTTTPRFLLSPKPNNTNNIINQTTQIIWGDYKAIKIKTSNIENNNSYEFDTSVILDNFSKLPTDKISNNVQEALLYINSSGIGTDKNLFNDTKLVKVGNYYYLLLPLSEIKVTDIEAKSTSVKDNQPLTNYVKYNSQNLPASYYLFTSDPLVSSNDSQKDLISLPVVTNNKITDYEEKSISGYKYIQVENYDLEYIDRFLETTGTPIYGAIGNGQYEFQIYDKQRNLTAGYLWLTTDKTETFAYGIFNTKDTAINSAGAQKLLGNEGYYSASKLFISSLEPSKSVPKYELTYKFYDYNTAFYEDLNNNYSIIDVKIVDKNTPKDILPSNLNITADSLETYLMLTYKLNNNDTEAYKYVTMQLTNELGLDAPKHSYPYDLEGTAIVSNANGPEHIYSNNSSSYTVQEGTEEDPEKRVFSTCINQVSDGNNFVTEEGLYIFKRTYIANSNGKYVDGFGTEISDLGDDKPIVYFIYYIDRSGIINVATMNSIAETLFEQPAQNFGFVLGSNYSDENLKKYVDSNTIQNGSNPYSTTSTNSNNHSVSSIPTTNKVQLQFNLTADKYNFNAFHTSFYNHITNKLTNDNKDTITYYLNRYLFNSDYFEKIYKLNLTIKIGNQSIIDESNRDADKIYNSTGITTYLSGSYNTSGKRNNSFNFYKGTSNANTYSALIKDSSGYRVFSDTNSAIVEQTNYLANELDISFNISHEAPTGDAYGKYYGRHNYDENKSNNANPSIPIESVENESEYRLLEKYLKEGQLQLQPLSSNIKSESNSTTGKNVKLYSTNNETLIFTFAITNDEYMAQIDPNNLTIYKDDKIIFNVVDGEFVAGNSIVSAEKMQNAYIMNTIDGIKYYAVIIFDNNLDSIVDEDESSYLKYRLLSPDENSDSATYKVKINYIGNPGYYVDENNYSYSNTTYEITIDRNKPTYNLTRLMSLDKFVYNPETSQINSTNYLDKFESYKDYYNFIDSKEYGMERSDLENYFFAVDYRKGSTFKFESISELDNNKGIYIRKVDFNNYKFSRTPDDYAAYYETTYLTGHDQFTPINAKILQLSDLLNNKYTVNKDYCYIPFSLLANGDINAKTLSVESLVANQLLQINNYYEIIESDEAGNYRVYAIYLPNYTDNELQYSYKINADSVETNGIIHYNDNSLITINGITFSVKSYTTNDKYLKANITITSEDVNELLHIYYKPYDMSIYVTNSQNKRIDVIQNISYVSNNHIYAFIKTINDIINNYKDTIKDKNGYTLTIEIVDRIGLSPKSSTTTKLNNYVFTYNVAGEQLVPEFQDFDNYFTMRVPKKNGTTNITKVRAYIFKNGWISKDPDDNSNSFYKSENELLDGFTYTLGKGVYKFELTDNFNRTNIVFHEFGTSSTQAGGSLRFNSSYVSASDKYTYTSNIVDFVYDSTIYNIYIAYTGETTDGYKFNNYLIYSNDNMLTDEQLRMYGISISTRDSLTTISMSGVNDLSKYHIKTISANIVASEGYTWGDELSNNNILVYDNRVAIYNPIQSPVVKNLNGIELDTSTQLNLTEDFEISLKWNSNIPYENRIDFNSRIVLTRIYAENNRVYEETISNSNKYIINKHGDYTAYVINALGNRSEKISFTRGEGEISMYTVMNVNNKEKSKLTPSITVNKEPASDEENREIIIFNYYTTEDYFSFKNTDGTKITFVDLENQESINVDNIVVDKSSNKYLDIVVDSNLSIYIQIYAIKKDTRNNNTPYAQFKIFSKIDETNTYTYRFIKVYFLPVTNSNIVDTIVHTEINTNDQIYTGSSATIKRPDKNLVVQFTPSSDSIVGNTIYISRYYNHELIETIVHNSIKSEYIFLLSSVGLHTFVVTDLAGRTQVFGKDTNSANSLQIYLINQIIFTVNEESPINKQYFNGEVNIKVLSKLSGVTLYSTDTLGVTGTRDGIQLDLNNTGELKFTQPGYYSIKMVTTTMLADESNNIADQEISSIYNFTIIKEDIAKSSFTVSKGDGFTIEKIIKIVDNQRNEVTEQHKTGDSLLLLTHEKEGNSKFIITLKRYDSSINDFRSFSFNVWINNESPIVRSNVTAGTTTKDVIELNYNPGKIYEQVGRAYIRLNNSVYATIDENSEDAVQTIVLNQKGEYYLEIVSEDGRIFNSYRFEKRNPINKTTQIALIGAGIVIVVLIILFLLIRRKGKYR